MRSSGTGRGHGCWGSAAFASSGATSRTHIPSGELVARVAPELCFHAAWIATPGAYLTSPENAVHEAAAEQLGRALVDAGCRRLVALGTCFEYAPSETPLSESSPLDPTTPYARAKHAAHERLAQVCDGTATSLAWARLFYLYGPYEDPRRLVPAVDARAARGPLGADDGRRAAP